MAYPTKADHPRRLLAMDPGAALTPGCRVTIVTADGEVVVCADFANPDVIELVCGNHTDPTYRWYITPRGLDPRHLAIA